MRKPANQQSRGRRAIRRLLTDALPNFTFEYDIDVAYSPNQRAMGCSWSTYANRKSDGKLYSVSSSSTIGDVIAWGVYVVSVLDGEISVMDSFGLNESLDVAP